jgi:ABC-2 type transport system permease protein
MNRLFSFTRWWGMVVKEFLQLRRDRLTFGIMIAVPVVQLLLFGYAINSDPKNMPAALVLGEHSQFTRSVEAALRNSEYFSIVGVMGEDEAKSALTKGQIYFVISVPADFSRRLLRGERPSILVEADATDPTATSGALGAAQGVVQSVVEKDLTGPLAYLRGSAEAFSIQVHRKYNPEGLTRYNIVPGLMGLILSMTTVMMTGLAITRERERGNMENLLSSPVTPLEIMTGKIVPYIFIGHIQVAIIIGMSMLFFNVPFSGNPLALYVAALLFVAANLTVGVTLSSFAKNQLQAMQMTIFYIMPNMLLSGFIFPFAGMPQWAQAIGSVLPLTYFNRCVRGVFLKGSDWADLWPSIWPVAVFCIVVMALSAKFFRRTLD